MNGAKISVVIPFDPTTLALQNGVVTRDSACLYRKIYIGLGPDGTPDTTPCAYTVPVGSSQLRANTLAANGLTSSADLQALQITAGP